MFDHNESLEQARERNINDALLEDIGKGDWTAMLVPDDGTVTAKLIVRQEAVLCGQAWFEG
ncbi:MAG: nicotinate-nucleotide diphosphorylase (carboxylating), partial [Polynucleobacter sp.]